jgi:hypothetical protein
MRQIVVFALIAAGHLVLSVALVFCTFGAGMARFDTLDGPNWTERAASPSVAVLAFPVLHLLDRQSDLRFPGLTDYVPTAANSLLWAWVIVALPRRRVFGRSP